MLIYFPCHNTVQNLRISLEIDGICMSPEHTRTFVSYNSLYHDNARWHHVWLTAQILWSLHCPFWSSWLSCPAMGAKEAISVIGKMSLSLKQPLLGRLQTLLKRMHVACRWVYPEHASCSITWTPYYILICWTWVHFGLPVWQTTAASNSVYGIISGIA